MVSPLLETFFKQTAAGFWMPHFLYQNAGWQRKTKKSRVSPDRIKKKRRQAEPTSSDISVLKGLHLIWQLKNVLYFSGRKINIVQLPQYRKSVSKQRQPVLAMLPCKISPALQKKIVKNTSQPPPSVSMSQYTSTGCERLLLM